MILIFFGVHKKWNSLIPYQKNRGAIEYEYYKCKLSLESTTFSQITIEYEY